MTADHLVEIDQEWSLWKQFLVRGAGFPAHDVLGLAAPELARLADGLRDLEATLVEARDRAIAAVDSSLQTLVGKDREPLVRVIKALRRGERPMAHDVPAVQELGRAGEQLDTACVHFAEVYKLAYTAMLELLDATTRDARFREAVLWQNRAAVHVAFARLLSGEQNRRARLRAELVVRYLQRYCTKNETIGFFGPFSWGVIEDGDATVVRPGADIVERRWVRFEHWAIDAMAAALASDQDLRLELAPRLLPTVVVEGDAVRIGSSVRPVPGVVARLLAACTGERSARQLAAELGDESEVYELLEELVEHKLVTWTIEIPNSVNDAERYLRSVLGTLRDAAARTAAIAVLDRLVAARDRVAEAAGPAMLDRALGELETTFTEATALAATRRAGEMYAGRTLVYLECRRDLEVRLGLPVVDRVRRVLVPVLQSARWFTFEVASRYRALAEQIHSELGGEDVPLLAWWERIAPHFPTSEHDIAPIVDEVAAVLEHRWSTLLSSPAGVRTHRLRVEDVAAAARHSFAAPHPGWPSARHLAPDVMIAAGDVAAIVRGELTVVLGELHIGNTMMPRLDMHPDPGTLLSWYEHDIDVVGVFPVEAKGRATRSDMGSRSERDYHVELGPSRSWRPPHRVLRIADLVIGRRGTSLVVIDPSRGLQFDVITYLDQYLTFATAGHFKLLARGRYTPRIMIDDVIVAREQWLFASDEVTFWQSERPELRFAAARRWAAQHGLPRHVFARTPEEQKPIFVDFESPLLIEVFAKMARAATSVSIGEMMPELDNTWLPDAAGRTYTSELRLVAVDARRFTPRA